MGCYYVREADGGVEYASDDGLILDLDECMVAVKLNQNESELATLRASLEKAEAALVKADLAFDAIRAAMPWPWPQIQRLIDDYDAAHEEVRSSTPRSQNPENDRYRSEGESPSSSAAASRKRSQNGS